VPGALMLAPGERVPDARVWSAPRQPVSVSELVSDGPLLLVFYLFDWSST
jgi:hypothetical protein